ncbi:hypothetical protein Cob_v002618 [Colletotrichum orbiculare MAFF 240422]|uniref:Uncharacterized protein n=2 Tax=Colletotrichum orbiculare species complex TaxID=2707354 RepID=N4USC0_COLOR|nr:hypothetical protein Cob_v002618 [Colletotrichum orbiculare MAFF 240422]TDZ32590.1 hypothetical protein C8035_v012169 [Colletotrichum spinosum]
MIGSHTVAPRVKVAGVVALVLLTVWYLAVSQQQVHEVARKFRADRNVFITDFLEHEVDGKFKGEAIQELCTSRKWVPGLVMGCENARGGVGLVRNAILHCVRFAIEAGAELIIPDIIPRSDESLKDVTSSPPVPFDYLFDNDHFHQVLGTLCPQMKLYSSFNELYNIPEVASAIEFSIPETNQEWVNQTVLADPRNWNVKFREFLDKKSPPEGREYPMRVHLKHTVWVWPTANDTAAVASSFGRILRFRPDARKLAASALFTLSHRYKLNIDPRVNYRADSFAGIHLHTEEDVNDKIPDYVTQAADYFHFLSEANAPVAFLASGATEKNVTSFQQRAEDFNVTVVTKTDLLDDEELEALDDLSWDQRALVDYEIMLRAGVVAGLGSNSFAWNLALRRAYAFGAGPEAVPHPAGSAIAWKDDFTTLYGKHEDHEDAMRATIWP